MQIFEFYFNPPKQPLKGKIGAQATTLFDSFCYTPANIYERRLGSLYITGLLKNALPQNFHFLEKLSKNIKANYYKKASIKPEKALQESLREANQHLEKIAKTGEVNWLGNLSMAVLSLKNNELNFTKVKDQKIFLLRKGEVIDLDQKVKFEDIEPYPLKIFGNIASGKLADNDLLVVLNKDIADFFAKEKILQKIAGLSPF